MKPLSLYIERPIRLAVSVFVYFVACGSLGDGAAEVGDARGLLIPAHMVGESGPVSMGLTLIWLVCVIYLTMPTFRVRR